MYVYEAANLDSHDKFFYSRVTWDVRLSFKLFFVVVFFFFFLFIWLVGLVWFGYFPLNFSVQILEKLERRTKHIKIWFSVCLSIAFDFVDVSKLPRTQTHQFGVAICSIFCCQLVYYLPSNQT